MMTPEQKRIKIAELCGWVYTPEHDVPYNTPAGRVFPESWRKETDDEDITACEDGLPDYLNSLDAMAQAEATLKMEDGSIGRYLYELEKVCVVSGSDVRNKIQQFRFVTAFAPQRADAFLITKGVDIS